MNGKEANNFQDFFNNPSLGAAKTDGKSPLPNGKVGTPTGSNTGLGTINPSQGLTGVGKSPEPNKGVDPAKLLGTTTGQISTNTNQPVGLGQNKPGATVQGDKGNAQGDKTNPKDAPGNPPAKTAFNKLFGL